MKIIAALIAVLALAGTASASTTPRFKLKPGITQAHAVAKLERHVNRMPGFSSADCWMSDGNARIGWRHGSCVGTYSAGLATYRFKATFTPLSCTKIRGVFVAPGMKTERGVSPWTHETFVCG
jgi:hypothetical protein